jgi:hypothetical protein
VGRGLEYNAMLRGVFQLIEARQNLSIAQRDEVIAGGSISSRL